MSTITIPPVPPDPSVPPGPPIETAPSLIVPEGPTLARTIGFFGLFFLVLGSVVVITTRALGPRWVPEGWGFMAGALGLALMLYHAVSDGEQEIRRLYGSVAVFWLVAAVVFSLVPGPFGGTGDKHAGYYLLPWGISAGLLSLLFAIPFCRHETDEGYRQPAIAALLVVGGLLAVGSVAAGIFRPPFLAGPGLTLALLGVGFLCAYLGQVETSDGIGYTVAFTLGAVGAGLLLYAIGRAAFPTLLFDGPAALRRPNGSLDWWKVAFRLLAGVAFVVPVLIAFAARGPLWLKATCGAIGLAGVGVVIVSLSSTTVYAPPRPFLVPTGMILAVLGAIYLAVSLGICSENQFVTLTRRELSAYFTSPIGYLVLGAMALIQWNQYRIFVNALSETGRQNAALREPIVLSFFVGLLPVIAILLQVPALTMRLVAEERRSGSMEVLLTAPVNEWPVILSKFLATWFFFLVCWLPSALFLTALWTGTGVAFDYYPLLSFYALLTAQGAAFVGMGLFFSTLTRNQIVAAVLTFGGMLVFLMSFIIVRETAALGLPSFIQPVLARLAFISSWFEALAGRLPLRDAILFLSIGAFWLFLSVKVLESRKWT